MAEKSYYEGIKQKKLKTVTITQTTVDYAIRFLCRQSLTLYEYSLISCFRDHIMSTTVHTVKAQPMYTARTHSRIIFSLYTNRQRLLGYDVLDALKLYSHRAVLCMFIPVVYVASLCQATFSYSAWISGEAFLPFSGNNFVVVRNVSYYNSVISLH